MYKEVDIYDIKDNLSSINLIDIRDKYLYNQGSIPNAINIPSSFLITNPSEYLNKEEEYFLFCSHGHTSKRVCMYLSKLGFRVVNIIGGYNSYIR